MDKEEFRKSIRKMRLSIDKTQFDFADWFNDKEPCDVTIARRDVTKYERGLIWPGPEKILKFIDLFDEHLG